MSTGQKRTLVHAVMAAAALTVVGMMYVELAELWSLSQDVPRNGPPPSLSSPDVTDALRWRLPAAMAATGFFLVVIGEGIGSLWRKPLSAEEKPSHIITVESR
jgi:nitroreductase